MAFRLCGAIVFEGSGFGGQTKAVLGKFSSSVLQSTSVPVSCLLPRFHSAADRLNLLIGVVCIRLVVWATQ